MLSHFIGEVFGTVAVLGENAGEGVIGVISGLSAYLASGDLGFYGGQFALKTKVFLVIAASQNDESQGQCQSFYSHSNYLFFDELSS